MIRAESDHVNWVLVVVLVALALLLAMVSSTAYGATQDDDSIAAVMDRTKSSPPPRFQQRKEVQQPPTEVWYAAREMYRSGEVEVAREMFERVLAAYPSDPAVHMWAGMAAYRSGDAATAIRHWNAVWCEERPEVWPAVALTAAQLESNQPNRAARFIVPLERGDFGPDFASHPVVSFYAARVYEQLAIAAPEYRDAVEESLSEKFSSALVSSDGAQWVAPNSQSWLVFLTKRALLRTIRGAWSVDWAAPVVPASDTVEPSLAPTVAELLECLASDDFAYQAHRKLRALELFQSPSKRGFEIFDDPESIKRRQFIA